MARSNGEGLELLNRSSNEVVDLRNRSSSEGLELLDFGDACVETRQVSPGFAYPDSKFQLGIWPG